MPPKGGAGDKEETRIIRFKALAGETINPSSLAPKVGPFGLPPKKVADDIKDATAEWKGQKVMVELQIIARSFTVSLIPTTSALVIKELKEPERDRKKVKGIKHDGNITYEAAKKIAKQMRSKSRSITFAGTLKEVLGTCFSVGCTIDGKHPKEWITAINNGSADIDEPL